MNRRTIDQDSLFQQSDQLCRTELQGKSHNDIVERPVSRSINHRHLAAREDFERLRRQLRAVQRMPGPRDLDFALQSPVVKILHITAKHDQHEFDTDILQCGEVEKTLGHRRFRQLSGFDQHDKQTPAELRDVLEHGSDIVLHAPLLTQPQPPIKHSLRIKPGSTEQGA